MSDTSLLCSLPLSADNWFSACLPRAAETAPTVEPVTPDKVEPQKVPAPPPLRKPSPEEQPKTPPAADPCRRYSTCEI